MANVYIFSPRVGEKSIVLYHVISPGIGASSFGRGRYARHEQTRHAPTRPRWTSGGDS